MFDSLGDAHRHPGVMLERARHFAECLARHGHDDEFRASYGRGKVGLQLQLAWQLNARQVALIANGLPQVVKVACVVTPKGDAIVLRGKSDGSAIFFTEVWDSCDTSFRNEQFRECCSPSSRTEYGDIHFVSFLDLPPMRFSVPFKRRCMFGLCL